MTPAMNRRRVPRIAPWLIVAVSIGTDMLLFACTPSRTGFAPLSIDAERFFSLILSNPPMEIEFNARSIKGDTP